jgi:hypothetical protein
VENSAEIDEEIKTLVRIRQGWLSKKLRICGNEEGEEFLRRHKF